MANEHERVTVVLEDLTWGDMEQIERLAGHPIARDLAMPQHMRAATMRALVAWKKMKEDPNFDPESLRETKIVEAGLNLESRPADPLDESESDSPRS